ncbi:MAG TPA: DUF3570 domain-containing protein [Steroidobacteraceae bacterium]|nr:DUF3570 domain-containing protein [Steroidobacteraceae bacterium]
MSNHSPRTRLVSFVITCLAAGAAQAGVLPEDRADALYFRYDGGGVVINGPSVLVRKSIGEHVSVQANHYIDMVSSASIDVKTSASPYDDERTQSSLSLDLLHGKSTYTLGAVKSDESDYLANTLFAGVSHDMFGDLTTIGFGYKRGKNDVFKNVKIDGVKQRDPAFAEQMESQGFNLSVSQIITKNLLLSTQYEVVTDEGFLRSPYRQVRFFIDPFSQGQQFEQYPNTRSSNAASVRAKYFLPYRAAVDAMYRFYTDTWGVIGHTGELGYVHPLDKAWAGGSWIFEGRVRYYTQTAADFYRDIFPRADFANFMARDKELATYNAITAGVSATYEFKIARFPWLSKGSLNLRYDYMTVNYDNFRDATFSLGEFGALPAEPLAPGTEPMYKLNANIIQFFISAYF